MQNKVDNIIAFFSGDILTTVLFVYSSFEFIDVFHPAIKVLLALVVGIFGGAGGLLGKDLYEWLKKKFKLWK